MCADSSLILYWAWLNVQRLNYKSAWCLSMQWDNLNPGLWTQCTVWRLLQIDWCTLIVCDLLEHSLWHCVVPGVLLLYTYSPPACYVTGSYTSVESEQILSHCCRYFKLNLVAMSVPRCRQALNKSSIWNFTEQPQKPSLTWKPLMACIISHSRLWWYSRGSVRVQTSLTIESLGQG